MIFPPYTACVIGMQEYKAAFRSYQLRNSASWGFCRVGFNPPRWRCKLAGTYAAHIAVRRGLHYGRVEPRLS